MAKKTYLIEKQRKKPPPFPLAETSTKNVNMIFCVLKAIVLIEAPKQKSTSFQPKVVFDPPPLTEHSTKIGFFDVAP